eukprot:CAMPEP_0117014682 /NCGR_PEP_ID=MMETSP0472-20121206/11863_1 /TAXON_ID=693140 ORGANISM="Tiarina fusus, Strain LIS" /NCGR_SAMPLE_ID=MMETSP0472 /ASSEMBLY_ACC=CAM_ASM_000603 /LENGTH=314 /DNA_ID=CAMNT_0004718297 /DNA_START=60 /DNA_END=1004 /DNA_ORIENTATION=-
MAPRRRSSTAFCPKAPTRQKSMDLNLDLDDDNDDDDDLSNMPNKDSNHTLETQDETDSSDDCCYEQAPASVSGDRAVHFKMTVKKRFIESHELYTEEERKACWYTSEEKETYTNKREKIVIRMEAGKPEKRSRPYRGLDCWTEQGSKVLNAQIARTIDAVMDEQDAQWDAGLDDHKRIAAMSQAVTCVSAEKALHIAYEDERAAIKVRGTAFDDANTLAGDDDSTVGMASIVAKKRRERRTRKSKKTTEAAQRVKRRSRKEPRPQQDPPGEMATPKVTKDKVKTKKVKTAKRSSTSDKKKSSSSSSLKQKRSAQ